MSMLVWLALPRSHTAAIRTDAQTKLYPEDSPVPGLQPGARAWIMG